MAFAPEKITKEHVLAAVQMIDNERIKLQPSTEWDVIINGKSYPPKEVMRYAHQQMNGDLLWERSGGEPTNQCLDNMDFLIRAKNDRADQIRTLIQEYKKTLDLSEFSNKDEKWFFVQRYKDNVDPTNPNFVEAFGSIKFANFTFRIVPAVIKEILANEPVRYQQCIIKLFNEDVDLTDRIKMCIQEVEAIYRKMHPEHNNSSHHDERTIATFLTLRNPKRYTLFMDTFYRNLCKLMGVKPKSSKGDKYVHYLKYIHEFTSQYIVADRELISLASQSIPSDAYPDSDHLLLSQDIVFRLLGKDSTSTNDNPDVENTDSSNGVNTNPVQATPRITYPLNQILYGPPGTGKTYNTVNKALEIIGIDLSGKSRTDIKKEFDAKVKDGQIVFTAFHQSMCYEDFIEGIKPTLKDDADDEKEHETLSYSIEDGIFKQLCTKAKYNIYKTLNSVKSGTDLSREELFETAYGEFLDKVNTALDNGKEHKVITKEKSKLNINSVSQGQNVTITHDAGVTNKTYIVSKQRLLKLFRAFNQINDIKNVYQDIRGVIKGCNTSAYWAVLNEIFNISGNTQSSKPINPVSIDYESMKTIVKDFEITPNDWCNLSEAQSPKYSNYVLIIDEINRGNVSQILGELITLIEEDKRLGKEERLEIVLPYSKSKFGVPPNLYIIGTMNTADRSVEALDIALRRRFSFQEMPPLYSVLDVDGVDLLDREIITGIKLKSILRTINRRIEKLLDKDHQIGHSYFLSVKDIQGLRDVFHDKIIPLLEEYFYGDPGKMGLVLGSGFVKINDMGIDNGLFASIDYEYDGLDNLSEKAVYSITVPEDDEVFTAAIRRMMM